MSVWAGFASRLPYAQEDARRRRVDTLKAFNEFKRQNPYATAGEFQTFIDASTGGSNYLRGGLPGQEIINNIAAENNKARQFRDMQNYTTQVKNLGEMEGVFDASLNNSLLCLKDGATEADYEQAATDFISNLPEGEGRDMFATRVRTRFNPTKRSELVRDLITDNLPQVTSYIKNSVGGDVTAENIANRFGVPADVANSLLTRANQLYQNEQLERQQTQFNAAVNSGINLIEADPTMDASSLTAQIKSLYPSITDAFAGDFFDRVAKEAKRKRDVTIADRERQIRSEATTIANSFNSDFRGDPVNQQFAKDGNRDGYTKRKLEMLGRQLTDEQFKLHFGKERGELDASYFDSDFDNVVNALQAQQRVNQETKRSAAAQQVAEASQQYIENNVTRADDVFAAVGKTGEAVSAMLESKYDMNPVFARAASQMTYEILETAKLESNSDSDPQPSPDDIVATIESNTELMQATMPINTAATNYGNKLGQLRGAFDVETFDSYNSGFSSEVADKYEQLEQYVSDTMASDLPLEHKRAALAAAAEQSKTFSLTALQMHRAREQRQDNWVTAGTGGWNSEAASGTASALEESRNNLAGRIDTLQNQITEQMATEPDVTDRPENTVATPLFSEVFNGIMEELPEDAFEGAEGPMAAMEAMTKLKSELRQRVIHPRNGKTLPGAEDTKDQFKMLTLYLDDVVMGGGLMDGPKITTQSRIAASRENTAKFFQDPIGYMLQDEDFLNKYPQFRNPVDQ